MKIISLNTWGGRVGKEKLLDFFNKHKDTADVFCLQEVWSAPYEHLEGFVAGAIPIKNSDIMIYGLRDISEVLDNHVAYFRPHHLDNYGLLMLIKKDLIIIDEGEVFVHKEKGYKPEGDVGNHARNVQYVTIDNKNDLVAIMNFHGLWNGKGKTDSDDRLSQSDKIVNFLKTLNTSIILCGDFNLLPDTKSLKMIEDFGLRNLIKEYNIKSTRTSFYTKSSDKYADYCFVSNDIKVKDFKVLPDEVSDHSPLYIEIE